MQRLHAQAADAASRCAAWDEQVRDFILGLHFNKFRLMFLTPVAWDEQHAAEVEAAKEEAQRVVRIRADDAAAAASICAAAAAALRRRLDGIPFFRPFPL